MEGKGFVSWGRCILTACPCDFCICTLNISPRCNSFPPALGIKWLYKKDCLQAASKVGLLGQDRANVNVSELAAPPSLSSLYEEKKMKNVSNNWNRHSLICTDGLQASAQEADGWLVHPHLIYVVCALSLKLLSLWLAAVVLLDGWCMFSAHRAGSDTGDVGAESIPISHLSETMKALLHTYPPKAVIQLIFHIWKRRGENKRRTEEMCLLTRHVPMLGCGMPLTSS